MVLDVGARFDDPDAIATPASARGGRMSVVAATTIEATSGAGHYLHWGVFSMSVTNFSIIVAMLVIFVLALVVPFGGHHDQDGEDRANEASGRGDSPDGGES